MFRILITGSRHWDLRLSVHVHITEAIRDYAQDNPLLLHGPVNWVSIVHGNCPYGADWIADKFSLEKLNLTPERYDADWSAFQRRAGFVRNRRMVNTAPDICLAFIRDKSKGSSGCRDLAKAAGIATETFYYENEIANYDPDPTVPIKMPTKR